MIRRFLALFARPVAAVAAPVVRAYNGLFSNAGADEGAAEVAARRARARATLVQTALDNVLTVRPRMVATSASGEVMDSVDGSGGMSLSPQGSPNLSDGIIGFIVQQSFIGHQLAAMLAQHWLILKACYMPARDAIRKGYEITCAESEHSGEMLELMKALDKRYRIKKDCVEFVGKGRIFGVRIAFFKVDNTDGDYYEKPFNPDGVTPGSYRGIVQVDPYWCSPLLDGAAAADPSSRHFYEPTWWQINGKKYHRSHLIVFREGDLADIMKPVYMYGGVPVPQKIVERVYAAERTANEAPQLAMTKRTTVMKTDVAQAIAKGPEFFSGLEFFTQMRDNYGIKVIGIDDEMSQLDTGLADFDEVLMSQYQLVASAADVPATKLLGTSPKGFNATGEYEESSYHEALESYQSDALEPLIERHHLLLMRSEVVPAMRRKYPDFAAVETSITFEELDSQTAKETAETNYIRAQTDTLLADTGAIDGYDIHNRLANDKNSGYNLTPVTKPKLEESDDLSNADNI